MTDAKPSSVGCLAWGRDTGRLSDIARELGATSIAINPTSRVTGTAGTLLRYGRSTVMTARWLRASAPDVVIVSSPPLFPALIALLVRRRRHQRLVLDAHPGAFGLRGAVWRLLLPAQKAVMRRAEVTMVTEQGLAAKARAWGGNPLVFHEAPPRSWAQAPGAPGGGDGDGDGGVMFTTTFDRDEPVELLVALTGLLEGTRLVFPGNPSLLPAPSRRAFQDAPNVELTGWLEPEEYLARLRRSSVVVALTTDPHSVMRGALEATWMGKPTVLSDTAINRELFWPSAFVRHDAHELSQAIRETLASPPAEAALEERRRRAAARWQSQRRALHEVLR